MLFEFQQGSLNAMCSFYLRKNTPWTQPHLQAFINLLYSLWDNTTEGLKKYADQMWQLVELRAKDLSVTGGLELINGPYTIIGSSPGAPLPSNIALKVDIRGETGGLPKRGGMFLPVGTEDHLHANLWDQAFLTGVQGSLTWFVGQATQVDVSTPVLVSRYLNGQLRPQAVTNPWKTWEPRQLVGTQRQRLRNK